MDTNTADLLKQLADKFGTTVEHLWSVLVKQATVNACANALETALGLGLIIAIGYFLRWLTKPRRKEAQDQYETGALCDWDDGWPVAISIILVVGVIVWLVVAGITVESVIVAINNPEYFALQEVLRLRH